LCCAEIDGCFPPLDRPHNFVVEIRIRKETNVHRWGTI
jgi:hypothetical protein